MGEAKVDPSLTNAKKTQARTFPVPVFCFVMACGPFVSRWLRWRGIGAPASYVILAAITGVLMVVGYLLARRFWPSSTTWPTRSAPRGIVLAALIVGVVTALADFASTKLFR
jgi:hypothetical protein